VNYAEDGGKLQRRDLNSNDLFPAMNLRYQLDKRNSLRFSFSRTVTRPSFIEMAPFLYQESYGSAQIRGNADLKNGYNYNLDLRYEFFGENGDMFSATAYYKHLEDPIEQIQQLSGGATIHSFQNANNGMAAGLEVEFRKELIRDLRLGANASFMYTDVKLPEGGAYTNTQRALQGASPYLVNAGMFYQHDDKGISASLLYNRIGKRIESVGVPMQDQNEDIPDIYEMPRNSLDLTFSKKIGKAVEIKAGIQDMLSSKIEYKQFVKLTDKNGGKREREQLVRSYRPGVDINVGVSLKF
jgi:outer membrane receptor protein involved in Fe transport